MIPKRHTILQFSIRKRYEFQGLEPTPSTQEQYAAYLRSETDKWAGAVRVANVKLD